MNESGPRVKFKGEWIQAEKDRVGPWKELAMVAQQMDRCGFTPVLPDGLCAGNLAVRTRDGLLVSKSGRKPGPLFADDFVEVLDFDTTTWCATYRSVAPEIKPSSDTPLHWMALVTLPIELSWRRGPKASLHGHAFATPEDIARLDLPASATLTEFGTPQDCAALFQLIARHPYPQHKAFIRRGHGFFVIGASLKDALQNTLSIPQRMREPLPKQAPVTTSTPLS